MARLLSSCTSSTNWINRLYSRYRRLRLMRIAMEQQFSAIDDLEMLSTSSRDIWWQKLQDMREREQVLARYLDAIKFSLMARHT